jgi:hypothetical protein
MSREPLAVRTAAVAVVAALVHVLVVLGVLDLNDAAEKAITAVVDAVAGFLIVLLVRPKVTPVSDPRKDGKALVPADG